MSFKKIVLRGITREEFNDIFNVKQKDGETSSEAILRVAKKNKGEKVKLERDEDTKKLKKLKKLKKRSKPKKLPSKR